MCLVRGGVDTLRFEARLVWEVLGMAPGEKRVYISYKAIKREGGAFCLARLSVWCLYIKWTAAAKPSVTIPSSTVLGVPNLSPGQASWACVS